MQINLTSINTKDKNLQLIQDNIQKSLVSLQQWPFTGGNYLIGITITAGTPLPVSHKLGRTPIIWSLGDQTSNSTVWRSSWDDTTITLNASATCTIALWVN